MPEALELIAEYHYGTQPPILISFPGCSVEWQPEHRRCVTRFYDGTEAHACPHDTDAYRAHAAEKSIGDVDLYCWQHDLAHVIVAMIRGGLSKVLWALAHGGDTSSSGCAEEEREAQEFQKRFFLRA